MIALESSEPLRRLVAECEARAGRSLEAARDSDGWAALLSWTDVAALAAEPLVELGSHSVDHFRLGLAGEAEVRDQLRRSKRAIEEQTRRPCTLLAYPNGSYTPRVAAIAHAEGYSCAVTTDEGVNPKGVDPLALRRIAVPPDADPAELLAIVAGLAEDLRELRQRLGLLPARHFTIA